MSDAKSQKSTIYIDADDEITAIIEKVRAANSNIVALVPPKRAPALQSIVNLKLLQRAARTAKKNLVLVTSEPALLPLAGTVGMMVAKTVSSKPEVPEAPKVNDPPDELESEVVESGEDPVLDSAAPIGELAGADAADEAVETIEVGDDETKPGKDQKVDKKKAKPDKKLKVPNFNSFRNKMLLAGGALILIVILFFLANVILPSAKIVIKTDSTNVTANLNVTAATTANSVDTNKLVVPMINQELKKTDSEKAPATGQRDDGTKASGTMALTNCIDDGQSHTVPAGTSFSSSDKTFASDKSVTLKPAVFSAGTCVSGALGFSQTVDVSAGGNGDSYNLSSRAYTASISGIKANGSDMTGGTSKIVKIVSQGDIDGAKQKVLDRIKPDAEKELKAKFDALGAVVIGETLKAGDPTVTSSPNANAEGTEVSVSITVTYTEAGVKKDDLKQVIEAEVKRQIDTSKQQVQDAGLDNAVYKVTSSTPTETKFQLQTVATAGPALDTEGIKKAVAGKKKGETTSIILARPGIKDVDISYSPFWVYGTPKNTDHIHITFEKANVQ